MSAQMRTTEDGPVVVSARSMRALVAIRREKYLPVIHGAVEMCQSDFDALADVLPQAPAWLSVGPDHGEVVLPERVRTLGEREQATLRYALAVEASLVLLESQAKERAKLSQIKSEGVLSLLVTAHRLGHLTAVQPMVKALQALGFDDVLPPPEQLEALWDALDGLQ